MKSIVSDIIGREREIQELRLILENTSVVVSSTRRMGKTKIESDDFEISKILTDLFEDMYVDRDPEGDCIKYRFLYVLL